MKAHGTGTQPEHRSPIEANAWPQVLTSRVMTAGAKPRVHGYCIESDLARHYRFSEVTLLALTGELPDEPVARAFDVALAFAAPVPVAEAPTHVGQMLRVVGSTPANLMAVATIALTERARFVVAQHAPLLAWLDAGESRGEFPAAHATDDAEERAAVDRLAAALAASDAIPALAPLAAARPTRAAAVLTVLHACGLARAAQLEAALTFAAFPLTVAESLAASPGAYHELPMNLPDYRYVDSSHE